MNRRNALMLLMFFFGIVAGYALSGIQHALAARKLAMAKKAGAAAGMAKLSRKLHLSQQQNAQLAGILQTRKRDIQALKSDFRPRYVALRETMKQEIQTVLDEDQKARFESMTEQAEKNYPWMQDGGLEPATTQQDNSSRPYDGANSAI
jgi:hypothetical protein